VVNAVVAAIRSFRSEEELPSVIDRKTVLWSTDEAENSLDLDSLDVLEIVFELEDSQNLTFNEEADVEAIRTVGDLAGALIELTPSGG
jgi:acyl carrier protein